MTNHLSPQTTSAYRRHQTTLIELSFNESDRHCMLSAEARPTDDIRGDELHADLYDAIEPLFAGVMGEFIPHQVDIIIKAGFGSEALATAAAVLRFTGYVVNVS
jgi:hypothetical protein